MLEWAMAQEETVNKMEKLREAKVMALRSALMRQVGVKDGWERLVACGQSIYLFI